MNEFTENEYLPNLELKFKSLENLRKPLTLKSTRKRIDIDIALTLISYCDIGFSSKI